MLAYIFPGQGAQSKGMGKDLFDLFPELTKKADEILGYSIKTLCLDDPNQQLQQTQFTQPALYVVNAFSYLKKIAETQQTPDYVSGHSLGEYNALLAAGIFDFETGLRLTQKRGALMSQALNGGMAAVIGLQAESVRTLLEDNHLTQVEIANYNSYTQLVISGPKEAIDAAQKIFSSLTAVNFIPLKVSGAFHSTCMQAAQTEFTDFLAPFEFATPFIPVIANVNAAPYHPRVAKANLANQITQPVLWTKIIEHLSAQGEMTFEEVGPGTVLKGLLRRIQNHQ